MASLSWRISPRTSTVIFFGQVAARHRDGHVGDVPDLGGEVVGHRVHGVGQVLPRARHLGHDGLAAQLPVGADLAHDARHLGREDRELLDHLVHDRGRPEELALERTPVHLEPHALDQIAARDGGDRLRHLACGPEEVLDERVDGALHVLPGAVRRSQADALADSSFAADDLSDPLQLERGAAEGADDVVEGVRDLSGQSGAVARQARGEITRAHRLQGGEELAGVESGDTGQVRAGSDG
jgi:hypothetical protein